MKLDQAKTRETQDVAQTKPQFVHRTSVFNEKNRAEISYIPIEKLRPFQNQGRKIFHEEELESLAETIREHGIRQPLTVLRIEEDEGIFFEVVSGERRLRAAKKVNLSVVPCIVIDDEKKAEEIAVIENIQRADLHPVEMACAIKKLVDAHGPGGQTALSKKLGMKQSKISWFIRLTTLSQEVQDFMMESGFNGRDNMDHLFKLKTDDQRLNFIRAYKEPLDVPSEAHQKMVSVKTHSVLRISLAGAEFKIQKSKLAQLSYAQKKEMMLMLSEILAEIRTDLE